MRIEPVTAARWPDLVELFGPRGAYGGCWCMYFRVTSAEFSEGCRNSGAANRAALDDLVREGPPPGLLAYDQDGAPVGWCALAPRTEFGRVLRSRTTKPSEPRGRRGVGDHLLLRSARTARLGRCVAATGCRDLVRQEARGARSRGLPDRHGDRAATRCGALLRNRRDVHGGWLHRSRAALVNPSDHAPPAPRLGRLLR